MEDGDTETESPIKEPTVPLYGFNPTTKRDLEIKNKHTLTLANSVASGRNIC